MSKYPAAAQGITGLRHRQSHAGAGYGAGAGAGHEDDTACVTESRAYTYDHQNNPHPQLPYHHPHTIYQECAALISQINQSNSPIETAATFIKKIFDRDYPTASVHAQAIIHHIPAVQTSEIIQKLVLCMIEKDLYPTVGTWFIADHWEGENEEQKRANWDEYKKSVGHYQCFLLFNAGISPNIVLDDKGTIPIMYIARNLHRSMQVSWLLYDIIKQYDVNLTIIDARRHMALDYIKAFLRDSDGCRKNMLDRLEQATKSRANAYYGEDVNEKFARFKEAFEPDHYVLQPPEENFAHAAGDEGPNPQIEAAGCLDILLAMLPFC